MYTVTVQEVQEKLPEILEDVKRGVEVVIQQNNIAIARIQPTAEAPVTEAPVREPRQPRQPGSALRHDPVLGTAEGQVWMSPDFDATPEDFADYL